MENKEIKEIYEEVYKIWVTSSDKQFAHWLICQIKQDED